MGKFNFDVQKSFEDNVTVAVASISDNDLSKVIEDKAGTIAALSQYSRIDTRQEIIDEINRIIDERVRRSRIP